MKKNKHGLAHRTGHYYSDRRCSRAGQGRQVDRSICNLGRAVLILIATLLVSCTQQISNSGTLQETLSRAESPAATIDEHGPESGARESVMPANTATTTSDPSSIALGTGTFVRATPTSVRAPTGADNDGVILNFQNADIQEVVKAVLGEMLGQNYVIDQGVTGTVTTETSGGLNKSDLLPVLETLLRQVQATLIKDGELYRIAPLATSLKGGVRPLGSRRGEASYGMQIVTLRYIAVAEMRKILEPILADGALIHADERRNLLILAGSANEQQRYLETIATFDVDWMKGMSTGIFALKHVAPDPLRQELEQALGGEQDKIMDGLVRLVALERLNALLAISPSRRALLEIKNWIARLDVPGDTSDPRLYVVRLQNAKAVEVAAILNEAFTTTETGQFDLKNVELAPGLKPATVESSDDPKSPAPPTRAAASDEGVTFRLGENVRIIADETNNGLVILATPREYEMLAAAIEKLDLIPLQVLIEASIIEVTLGDTLEYGVEWFFKNNLATGKEGAGLLDLGAAGIGTLAPSFSYTIVDSAGQVRAALNALATESQVSILSSPSLMVLDNQTATINVGDEIPIPTRSSVSNIDPNAPTVNEIEYRNTGVTLQVTPRVNAGGLVTMEIDQEVSDAVNTTSSDINAPTIQQRKITSTVAVQSGETIVLGGLIRDNATNTESGLPYLRNIPVVGKLFGTTRDTTRRTELIVLITPRAVDNDADAREVTREYSEKMKNFERPDEFELRH